MLSASEAIPRVEVTPQATLDLPAHRSALDINQEALINSDA
jgi:hypothetical protein